MKKHIYFWIFAVAAVIFFKSPLLNYSVVNEDKSREANERIEIDAGEMDSFLKVWPKYLHSNVASLSAYQVSFANGRPSKTLHPKVIKWLNKRGWNADRFFYVEQRLRAIIKTVEHERHIIGMMKTLEGQLQNESNPSTAQSMKQAIDAQMQSLNVERISRQELDMAEPHAEEIKAVLDGKVEYRRF